MIFLRLALTHSFNNQTLDEYIGKIDTTAEETALIKSQLQSVHFDEYDKLIQLCDALAGAEGVLDIELRMEDVKQRYGFYPKAKWDSNMRLKKYFETKTGTNIYTTVEKETFQP